ncbi:cell envelope biogenesis protein OmpA [Aureimonas sp. Leaf454]|uniref:outer membrane protein n=1 Tax=Aureimonas sp. Leaf454 TaxID=1736381 RepID=UPI0006F8FFCF|nr:outer membrane protein [Aureimonas sp. Leaf454]KQT50777.1 cell envelope biogenesis protein OmpA [Aureimonas sp. Leaf454]
MTRLQGSILVALALFGATPAWAADAVTPDVAPIAPIEGAAPIYIWSGAYAGAFVGYNRANFDQSAGASFDGEGIVGGAYGGFNVQNDRIVYGIEADLGASGVEAGGFDRRVGLPVETDTNVFGSLRGRVGVAADPFLVFATAGVAASDQTLKLGPAEDSNTHVGYTVGAGVEAKVTDSIDTRLEYRYSDFGSKTYDFGAASTSSGFDEHSIRAGIALKF